MHCAVPKPAPRVVAIVRRGGGHLPSVAGGWRRFGCAASSLQSEANDRNADKYGNNEEEAENDDERAGIPRRK